MSPLNFVAVDVEKANAKSASICQIGLAKVINGVVTKTATELVLPPAGFRNFSHQCIRVHGITYSDVKHATEWDSILDRLIRFTGDLPLIGHHVGVEKGAIAAATEAIGREVPVFEYLCSLKLAKAHIPGPHGLSDANDTLGLPAFKHHDAGEDAAVSAQIVLAIAKRLDTEDLHGMWTPATKTAASPRTGHYVRSASARTRPSPAELARR